MRNVVLFDLDGTLLDTLPGLAAAGNNALMQKGFPVHPAEAYRQMVGNGISKLVERMIPRESVEDAFAEVLAQFHIEYAAQFLMGSAPYEGIVDMLSELKEQGKKCAVITNKAQEYCAALAAHYFEGLLDYVIGAAPERPLKPNPAGIYEAMNHLGTLREQVLYVGDSNVDIQTARNAQVVSCGVTWGFRTAEELEKEGADYIVHHPMEILSILK